MICLHHLRGDEWWVNPDLILFMESAHDTIITLVDGKVVRVAETPAEVARIVTDYRATVIVTAEHLAEDNAEPGDVELHEPTSGPAATPEVN